MRLKHLRYYLTIVAAFALYPLFAQSNPVEISGVINKYARVDSIFCLNNNDIDTVKVSEIPAGLKAGDIVMVHHIKGASINSDPPDGKGEHKDGLDKSGIYSIFKVEGIRSGPKYIILNYSFQFSVIPDGWNIFAGQYLPGEAAQLVTIPRYEYATVNGELTASAWDPVAGVGGICALWVDRTLTLDANIDVSGKGFKGADPQNEIYFGDSSIVDTTLYNKYFYDVFTNNRAGLKGEGITDKLFSELRGRGSNISGGGGGNGLFSGGGGGSNGSAGGNGGEEVAPSTIETGGLGGYDLPAQGFYSNTDQFYKNRIFFGGGGGTGTQIPADGFVATRGGAGGGIVIILADSIKGNDNFIIADGEAVLDTATAGAGGGGAGGAIMIHSNYLAAENTLNLSAVGGCGGWTKDNPSTTRIDATGPGGGGGGGVYWLFDSIEGDASLNYNLISYGCAGRNIGSGEIGAGDGGPSKKVLNGLDIQVRGFLFNSITGNRTICSDVMPPRISGSEPHGGNAPFSYKWIRKIKEGPWEEMPGETGRSLEFLAPLPDTTSFRRIAISAPPIVSDTSFITTYYVHPALTGNTVVADDKICAGELTGLLNTHPDSTLKKGLGPDTYSYKWRKRWTSGAWFDASESIYDTIPSFEENLNDTAFYKRIANSGACFDTSNVLTIEVLQQLTFNKITEDQILCFGGTPEDIQGPKPSGGDQDSIYYLWEQDSGPSGTYVSFPFSDSINRIISPPALNDTTLYRRFVYSGTNRSGNYVCTSMSDTVEVIVLDTIINNIITTPDQIVCQGLNGEDILANAVSGGDGTYSYWWEASSDSLDQLSWRVVGSNVASPHDPALMDSTTTFFRRTVGSGGNVDSVCIDQSYAIEIRVIDSIAGNTISTDDSIMCQFDTEPGINGGTLTGGGNIVPGVNFRYGWKKSTINDPEIWNPTTPSNELENFTGGDTIQTPDDLWFWRVVYSGPDSVCVDTSASQKIRVQTAIKDNWNTISYPQNHECVDLNATLIGDEDPGLESETAKYEWLQLSPSFIQIEPPGPESINKTTDPLSLLGVYEFVRVVTKGECEDTSNILAIDVKPRPTAQITNPTTDETCEDDPNNSSPENRYDIVLNLTGQSKWKVILNDGSIDLDEKVLTSSMDSIQIFPSTDDVDQYTYTLVAVEDSFGCTSRAAEMTGSLALTVYANPAATIFTDTAVCGPIVALTADPGTGDMYAWTQVVRETPVLTINNPNTINADVDIGQSLTLEERENFVFEFMSESGTVIRCRDRDTLQIVFYEEPVLSDNGEGVDAGAFSIQYWSDIAPLTGTTNAGSGIWSTSTEGVTIDDPDSESTYARNLILYEAPDFPENLFEWTVSNGVCPEVTDTVGILRFDVKLYEGFSPNGDGYNDFYILQGLYDPEDNSSKAMFKISFFNAGGNLVRTVTQDDEFDQPGDMEMSLEQDERIVWDGLSNNGSIVPPGIYYYGIEYYTILYDAQQSEIGRVSGKPQRGNIVVKGY